MTDFAIKEGATLPELIFTIYDRTGAPLDLTDCTATFFMRATGETTPEIDGESLEILDPATSGKVRYVWAPGDTATPGEKEAEAEVTFPDSRTERRPITPDHPYMLITVLPKIGS